jgi:hypothetical protein
VTACGSAESRPLSCDVVTYRDTSDATAVEMIADKGSVERFKKAVAADGTVEERMLVSHVTGFTRPADVGEESLFSVTVETDVEDATDFGPDDRSDAWWDRRSPYGAMWARGDAILLALMKWWRGGDPDRGTDPTTPWIAVRYQDGGLMARGSADWKDDYCAPSEPASP